MQALGRRQQGLVWGAILGDVIGAYVENDKSVTELKLDNAFKICGGGIRKLQPGQATDDSQLTLAVAKALSNSKGVLNLNTIASEMANWFLSKPIDVGNTIRNSVPKACNMKEHQAHVVRKGASERSQKSQSNGTLMCISPLVLWCQRLTNPDDIYAAVREFTILIHPNQTVVLANTFYVMVCVYLLNNPHSETRAVDSFTRAKEWVLPKNNAEINQWIQIIENTRESFQDLSKAIPPQKAQGWIKIAFSYAMHFLISQKTMTFKSTIRSVIKVRGDTDTNACIVGAVLGAYMGLDQMGMEEQIEKIKKFEGKVYKRPQWLIPGKVLDIYIRKIVQVSPAELKMVGNSTPVS